MNSCTQCGRDHSMELASCPHTGEPIAEAGLCGKQVDRYRVDEWLGGGGFGAVYRAVHVVMRRQVALKVMHLPRRANANMIERFIRESQASDAIGSPHIVRFFDAGRTEDGDMFLAMELVDGCSLHQLLSGQSPLPLTRTLRIALQVMAALEAAHRVGIVHRDIKPANIMLEGTSPSAPSGRDFVKLVDFGISKIRDEGVPMGEVTQTGVAMGTPGYAAPEQYRSARDVDHRADVYAMAVVLYRMLAGELPFNAESFAELVIQVSTTSPPPLLVRAPGISPELAAVIDRGLAREPYARWADIRQFAAALIEAAGPGHFEGVPELASFLAALAPDRETHRQAAAVRGLQTIPPVESDEIECAPTLASFPPPHASDASLPSGVDSVVAVPASGATPRTPPGYAAHRMAQPTPHFTPGAARQNPTPATPAPASPATPRGYPPGQVPATSGASMQAQAPIVTITRGEAVTTPSRPSDLESASARAPEDPPVEGASTRRRRTITLAVLAISALAILAIVSFVVLPQIAPSDPDDGAVAESPTGGPATSSAGGIVEPTAPTPETAPATSPVIHPPVAVQPPEGANDPTAANPPGEPLVVPDTTTRPPRRNPGRRHPTREGEPTAETPPTAPNNDLVPFDL